MEKIKIYEVDELAQRMIFDAERGKRSCSVLFYDQALELMLELYNYDDVISYSIDISDHRFDGYEKEYYVMLDDQMILYVEPAYGSDDYGHGFYKRFESDVLYIDGSAKNAIIDAQMNSRANTYEIEFLTDYDSDDLDESVPQKHSNLGIVDDILDLIDFLKFGCNKNNFSSEDDILDFIQRRFPKDSNWCTENCYYFALILNDRFPGGKIYYDVINGHFSYKYGGKFYDHTGEIDPDGYLVEWTRFSEYDDIQYKIVIRDCIL